MAVSYQYFAPGMAVALLPLLNTQIKQSTWFIWGSFYMGILHLFLLNLANDSSIIAAITIWLLASLYFGLFYGIGGWLLTTMSQKTKIKWQLLLPVIWLIIEYAKSIGSFGNTNGNLGIGLSSIIEYLPITSIIGHFGLGLLLIIINVLLWQRRNGRFKKESIALIIGILLFSTMVGHHPTPTIEPTNVSVIQTNIPQQQKTNPVYWPKLETTYFNQIKNATGTIIILPETILPTVIHKRPWLNQLQTFSNQQNKTILFGSFIQNKGTYNGSIIIQPNQSPIFYKKQRLMPFGETLPFRSILSKLIPSHLLFSDFDKGSTHIDIQVGSLFLRPIICLEGIYSHFYKSKGNSIVAIHANNAWYDTSTAGSKFVKFAQVHAAEFQTMVLVSANLGQSAIIAPSGKQIAIANHQNAATLTEAIITNPKTSIYHRYPWFGVTFILICWLGAYRKFRKQP